jgi:Raf kinase inhibitor-like YbhB/YbcL family protein
MTLTLTSPAFVSEEQAADPTANTPASVGMPPRFAMRAILGGHNISIPYVWQGAPIGTRSFALALVDTAPVAHNWVHWLVIDLPADSSALPEAASGTSAMPHGAMELRNTFGTIGYGGPQPPIGTGAHPYVATLYALDTDKLAVLAAVTREEVLSAMDGHVLASATCTGRFGR